MKKILLPALLLSAIALTSVFSCKKTENTVTPAAPVASLNTQLSAFRSAPQTYSVPVGIDTTVFGNSGTLLRFYPNSFKDGSGNIITTGSIDVQLTEIYSPGDMISNRSSTMMATGEILQSCGQIKVSATMGAQPVYANRYGIGFKQKDTSSELMGIFYATASPADSMTIWTQSNVAYQHGTKKITTTEWIGNVDSTRTDTCYFFDEFRDFSIINCNWFTKTNSRKVGVAVTIRDGSFDGTNTQLFLVLPKTNAGWTGNAMLSNMGDLGQYDSTYDLANHTLRLKTVGSIGVAPVGLQFELVALANKGGKYFYWATSGIVPDDTMKVSATLSEAPKDSIVAWLKQL